MSEYEAQSGSPTLGVFWNKQLSITSLPVLKIYSTRIQGIGISSVRPENLYWTCNTEQNSETFNKKHLITKAPNTRL